jgi:hypothetical protein
MSIGLFSALGGMTIGGTATGGFAIGGLAQGGGAIGYMAQGGMAIGHYARGGGAFGTHVTSPGRGVSQAAQDMFANFSFFFSDGSLKLGSILSTIVTSQIPAMAVVIVCGILALLAIGRDRGSPDRIGS